VQAAEWKKGDEELRKVNKEASLQRAVWRNGGGKCRFER